MQKKTERGLWLAIPVQPLVQALRSVVKGHRKWSGIDGGLECHIHMWKRRRVLLVNLSFNGDDALRGGLYDVYGPDSAGKVSLSMEIPLEPIGTTARRTQWARWVAMLTDIEFGPSSDTYPANAIYFSNKTLLQTLLAQAVWRVEDSFEVSDRMEYRDALELLVQGLPTR